MKKYGVIQRYFDNGKVEVKIRDVQPEEPDNYKRFESFDYYLDVFDNYKEAIAFMNKAKKA